MQVKEAIDPFVTYGIDRVSGFYGPGSWGAWILLVLSVLLDKIFIVEEEEEEDEATKRSRILGIDINLLGAFAYPAVAAIDLLANMHIYFDDRSVSDSDLGRFMAPLVVLREGFVLGSILLIVCVIREASKGSLPKTTIFSVLALSFFLVVNKIMELRYSQRGIVALVLMGMNQIFNRVYYELGSTLAAIYSDYEYNINSRKHVKSNTVRVYELPFLVPGVFTQTPWQANLFLIAVCLANPISWIFLSKSIIQRLSNVLTVLPVLAVGQAILDIGSNASMIATLSVTGYSSPIPVSGSKLIDFDQITAFIIAGVIPLLFSIHSALSENADTFTGWWRATKEAFQRFKRLFRRRAIWVNF